jgi:hypothetical protein
VRKGLLPASGTVEDPKSKGKTRSTIRAHKAQLVAAGWVGRDGERVFISGLPNGYWSTRRMRNATWCL